jgi:hypothetical protein
MLLDPIAFVQKWNNRFQDNDMFEIGADDLREMTQDVADSFGDLGEHRFNELVLPQTAIGGKWYITDTGVYEARRTFTASAAPVNGPNWRLIAGFQDQRTSLNAADILDASEAGRAMLKAPTRAAQRALVDNPGIAENQYALNGTTHPGWTATDGDAGSWKWVIQEILALKTKPITQVVQQPAAPTEGHVNDIVKEFTFKVNPLFPNYTQYKENGRPGTTAPAYLSAATAYQVDETVHVTGLAGATKGSLAYYVGGSGNIPDGKVLTNGEAFSGSAVPPPTTGDTVAPSVTFTVPAAGATLAPYSQVLLTVTANDNVAVQGLVFTNGATGEVIGAGAKNGSTYTFPYTTGAAGPLSLVATATDAAGNSQSATTNVTVQAATTTPTNTTPDAPFPSYDPVTRVLTYQHALGTSELEYNRFGGTFTSYLPIQVDDSSHAAGEWKARVKAMIGRNASGTADSPPIAPKAVTVNQIPTANAGQDIVVTQPTNSVALMGSGLDTDGTIVSYLWEQLAGPSGAGSVTGLPATTKNVVISDFKVGSYQFELTVTDDKGATASDFVILTVNAAAALGQTIILSQQGFVSDANLDMGSTSFGTDQTAKLEALLASLDQSKLTTIINDCRIGVDRILFRSNIAWQNNAGCGVIQRPNVAEPLLQNKNAIGGRGALTGISSFDHDITLRGGVFNGAGYDTQGNPLRPISGTRAWNGVYSFIGVRNLVFEDVEFRNGRSIIGRVGNFSGFRSTRCRYVQSPTLPDFTLRQDGPKFLGPFENALLEDTYIDHRADDVLSICGGDVWFPVPGHFEGGDNTIQDYDTAATYGPINGFTARRTTAVRGVIGCHGIRFMTAGQKIDNVLIDGMSGTICEYFACFDNYRPSELFWDTTGQSTPLFGKIEFINWDVDFIPNTDQSYYPSISPQGFASGLVGAGFQIKAQIDNLRISEFKVRSGISMNYPFLAHENGGNLSAIYGNNVTIAGVTKPVDSFKFFGTVGPKTGNVFDQVATPPPPATGGPGTVGGTGTGANPNGAVRQPVSSAAFVQLLPEAVTYLDTSKPNQTLFVTDTGGIHTTSIRILTATAGQVVQIRVFNFSSQAFTFEVPGTSNHYLYASAANYNPVTYRNIPIQPGEAAVFQIDFLSAVNWWLDSQVSPPYGFAGPVPAGYVGAVAPIFIPNEFPLLGFQEFIGNDVQYYGGTGYDGSGTHYWPAGSNGGVKGKVAGIGFALRALTQNTADSGRCFIDLIIDGVAQPRITANQRQVSPNGTSWEWFTYIHDGNWHIIEWALTNDPTDTGSMGHDGYRAIATA